MKFLCIGYFNPAKMDALSPSEFDAAMRDCPHHMAQLSQTGRLVLDVGVDTAAKYLQRKAGRIEITDAIPGADPEKIGCMFIVEAADISEATRLAALHPTTQISAGEHLGWRLEVRPIHSLEPSSSMVSSAGSVSHFQSAPSKREL